MTDRGERRRRTEIVASRRAAEAKRKGWTCIVTGKFRKRHPVCYCTNCTLSRKPGPPRD